jgi:hypothetical protein
MFAVSNLCEPWYDFVDAASIATISTRLLRVTSLGSLYDKENTLSSPPQKNEIL